MHACVRWPGYLSKFNKRYETHHANSSNLPKKTTSQILDSKGSRVVGWPSTMHWSLIASQNSTFNWTLRGVNAAQAHGWVISSSKKISYFAEQSTFLWLLTWSTQKQESWGLDTCKATPSLPIELMANVAQKMRLALWVHRNNKHTYFLCLICIPSRWW